MKWYEKKLSEPNICKGFSPELYESLSWYGSGKHMQQYLPISGLSTISLKSWNDRYMFCNILQDLLKGQHLALIYE